MNTGETEVFYMEELRKLGTLELAKRWLKKTPVPEKWKPGPYSYAWCEMNPTLTRFGFWLEDLKDKIVSIFSPGNLN